MNRLNRFDKYLKGALPEEETESFTKEIVKDYFETEALKERWNAILQGESHSDAQKDNVHSIGARKWKSTVLSGLAVAASILLLLFAWFSYEKSPNHEKLLAAYIAEPYQESISRKGPIEELQKEALNYYNTKDYVKASTTFEKMSTLDQEENWVFYIGLCQLYQDNAAAAIQYFNQSLNHSNQKYNIETHWYLGLAHTMNKNLPEAQKHIGVVANHSEYENGWKVQEAKTLLEAFPNH